MAEVVVAELRSENSRLREVLRDLVASDFDSGAPGHHERTAKARAALALKEEKL
jgi:hypothetical protein